MIKTIPISIAVISSVFLSAQDSASVASKNPEINTIPVSDSISATDLDFLKKKFDLKDVALSADTTPEFMGGMKQFRKRFFEFYKASHSKKDNNVRLYFIVEKTGYVRNYIAISPNKKLNKDAETAMQKVFERWKPATIKNQAVRYLMVFPVSTETFIEDNKEDENSKLQNINAAEIPDLNYLKTVFDLKGGVSKADTAPEFPNGMKAFKRKYFEVIETLNLKNNEKLDVHLYFIVEENGYVRNVTAVGKNKKHVKEAELGISRLTERWKPATINGKPVRYLFYFPLVSKKYD